MDTLLLALGFCALAIGVKSQLNVIAQKDEGVPCTCGVFLDQQLERGELRLDQEHNVIASFAFSDERLPANARGRQLCIKKCVDMALKHAHEGPEMLCAIIKEDIHRQKAHLFIKVGIDKWINTKLNSGREFSCKDGKPVKKSPPHVHHY